jgi:hypothetical protein
LEVPAALCLFFFDDRKALGKESDCVGGEVSSSGAAATLPPACEERPS